MLDPPLTEEKVYHMIDHAIMSSSQEITKSVNQKIRATILSVLEEKREEKTRRCQCFHIH